MKTENRTFIISGGSSGLGLATTENLIKSGSYVAILDLKLPPSSLYSPSGSSSSNQRLIYIKTDVTKEEETRQAVERTVAWTQDTGATLGGVINCAGIGQTELLIGPKAALHSLELWERILAVNVTGTFNVTRFALQHLVNIAPEDSVDGERGVIIMVASVAADEGQPGQTAYAASKGAIRSLALPMARELARHHIRAVTIAPGPFTTPMTDQFTPRVHDNLAKRVLLFPKRYGMPKEFAVTVKWILECAYVNGETIRLTAGARIPAYL